MTPNDNDTFVYLSVERRNLLGPIAEQIHRLQLREIPPQPTTPLVTIPADRAPWLWRSGPPYRTTASGICFSYKGVKKHDR